MSRTYPFTIWEHKDPDWEPPEEGHPDIKFFVCQPEYTKTGLIHFQGFVRFHKPHRIPSAQRILGCSKDSKFITPTKGTDQDNIKYCTDPEKRVKDTEPIMWGTPSSQGRRKDLISVYESGLDGTLRFDETTIHTYARCPRFFEKCMALNKGPPIRDVTVTYVYGPPGS